MVSVFRSPDHRITRFFSASSVPLCFKILGLLSSVPPRFRGGFDFAFPVTAMSRDDGDVGDFFIPVPGRPSAQSPQSPPDTPASYAPSKQSRRKPWHHGDAIKSSGSGTQSPHSPVATSRLPPSARPGNPDIPFACAAAPVQPAAPASRTDTALPLRSSAQTIAPYPSR